MKLKVSKASWHYRLYKWTDCPIETTTLCGYYWVILICLVAGTFMGLCLLIVRVGFFTHDLYRKLRPRKPGVYDARYWESVAQKPPKQSPLWLEWLKAKKNRVCPMIDFEDAP